jgi:hypothetical protein
MFYLPCQAGCGESDASFFIHAKDGRKPLDVLDVIRNPVIDEREPEEVEPVEIAPEPYPQLPTDSSSKLTEMVAKLREDHSAKEAAIRHTKVAKAIADWRGAPPHMGNESFFMLGVRLQRAGLVHEEIRQILVAEAINGRSPAQRKAQIRTVLKSLKGH